ncbi:MAG: HD domain-containing protein, partial [Chloroflexota bacterium]|nr:HD domain-containing protein [Chloroflexota bacterium]
MDDLREFRTVVLAALLHDIGKFLMRGRDLPFPIKGTHPEVSQQFVSAFADTFTPVADIDLLKTLVLCHHQASIDGISDPRQRILAHLVNKADRLSAGERGQRVTGGQDYKTTPLASVFPRLFAGEARPQLRRHHPVALSAARSLPGDIFPADFPDYARGELEKALTTFGNKASPLLRSLEGKDFDTVVSHLLALLAAHTWPIPADTQEEVPDISLYDHLRTTAAIASCLYQYYEERNSWQDGKSHPANGQPFVLAVGDVSGIQEYIFDIRTGTDAPLAKRLRARSLFIQLIGEVVPLKILQEFQL